MEKLKRLFLALVAISSAGWLQAAHSADQPTDQLSDIGCTRLNRADTRPSNHESLKLAAVAQQPSSDFAFKLFDETTQGKEENILLSPFSAYAALSMVLNGAAGSTRDQMAKALGISGTIDALNSRNQAVYASLTKNDNVQLEIANAVYSDKDTPFKKAFIELCQQVYAAEAHSEDFKSPDTIERINSWCSNKTHGKISKILDKLSKEEKMVLLNAIYFKGKWAHQFEKARTQDDEFMTTGGAKTPVKMMHQHNKFAYMRGANFDSLAIPYAGERQRMYIFLPDPNVKIAAFQTQLNKENWDKWMASYRLADVDLSLPRFKMEYSSRLNDALIAMGMGEAFERHRANFSNLVPPPYRAWISRVLQKTYMDVNEEGTEAAAVTAVVVGVERAARLPSRVIEFRVDRPFVLALVDDESKEVLFLGSVVKP